MSGSGTGTINKAMLLLELVSASQSGLTYIQLERETGMPRATVARLASSLLSHGFLMRSPRKGVCIGPRAHVLADRAERQTTLADLAEPVLREMSSRLGEGCYLCQRRHGGLIYVAAVASAHKSTPSPRLGTGVVLHASAVGQAYLAALPDEYALDCLAPYPLRQFTSQTLTTRDAMAARLCDIRERTVAVAREELHAGAWSLGVVVSTSPHCALGGIGLSIPTGRAQGQATARAADLLLSSKRILERKLNTR